MVVKPFNLWNLMLLEVTGLWVSSAAGLAQIQYSCAGTTGLFKFNILTFKKIGQLHCTQVTG